MKIHLINMPFSSVQMPSLALTQLKSIVEQELGSRVSVEILHLNHHFGKDIGIDEYSFISEGNAGHRTGFGEWFFRQAAFPDLPDNAEDYFRRYSHLFEAEALARFGQQLVAMRKGLNLYLDRLIEAYAIDQADLVGFTSMFFQTLPAAAMANRIKARNPNAVTVMGGANCEAQMGIELAHALPSIDYVFSGPALISFPQLIRSILAGRKEECESIDGVFTKRNTRSAAHPAGESTPQENNPARLSQVGILGRELNINVPIDLDYDSFLDSFQKFFPATKARIKPFLLFETSRGCWWGQKSHCTFCGLNGGTMNYRAMDVSKARDLIQTLFRRYADKVDYFSSVDNILPKNYLTDLLPQLDVPSHVSMFYEVKADLKEEDFRTLAKAHVFRVQPGIESLASSTLRLMRKGTTAFGNIQFLRRAVRYNIQPAWNLLVGFPGEGEDVYRKYIEDIPRLVHLFPPYGVFPVRFDRFSPYFDLAREYKLELRALDFYSLSFPCSDKSLQNIAYYFYDQNREAGYALSVARFIRQLEKSVDYWRTRWSNSDNLLPPRLTFRSDRPGIVYDSRSGIAIEHSLSEAEWIILNGLENALDLDLLCTNHPALARTAIEQAIQDLLRKGLLFEEKGRWISLVLPQEKNNPGHGSKLSESRNAF